jgi:hypothetical protein
MKNYSQKLLLPFFLSTALSTTAVNGLKIHQGWNLFGSGDSEIDLQKTFSSENNISYLWSYSNGNWSVYGNNSLAKIKIAENNITSISQIPAKTGFWLKYDGNSSIEIDLNLSTSQNSQIELIKDWNLVSSNGKKVDFFKTFSTTSSIPIIWTFDNATQSWGVYGNNSIMKNAMNSNSVRSVSFSEIGSAYWVLNSGSEVNINSEEYKFIEDINTTTLLLKGNPICADGGKIVTTQNFVDEVLDSETNTTFCGLNEIKISAGTYTDANGSICQDYNNIVSFVDNEIAYSYNSNSCACTNCSVGTYSISIADANSSGCSFGGESTVADINGSLYRENSCYSYTEYLTKNSYQEFVNEFNQTVQTGDPICSLGGIKTTLVKSVGLYAGENNISVDTNYICDTELSIALAIGKTPIISSTVTILPKGDSQCFYGGKQTEYIKKIDTLEIDRWKNIECYLYATYSINQNIGEIVETNLTLPVGDETCINGGVGTKFTQKIGVEKDGDDINKTWSQISCNLETVEKTLDKTPISDEVFFVVSPELPTRQIGDNLVLIETPDLPSAVISLDKNDTVENIIDEISKDLKDGSNGKITEVTTQKSNNCDNSVATELTILNRERVDSKIVLNDILKVILGTSNISINSNTTTLADFFKARIVITEVNGKLFASVSVIDNSLYSEFSGKMKTITSCNNFQQKEYSVLTHSQTFDSNGSKIDANVLFVIDDSGSMSDDQDAVKQAITDFGNEFEKANLGFRAGIITTGNGIKYNTSTYYYTANEVLLTTGIIENNLSLLKEKSIVGIRGHGTETGIFNSEYALSQGSLARTKFKIDDSSQMSVIIISDEPSQYKDRSGGKVFNPKDNIFVSNKWKVHVIVTPEDTSSINYYWSNPGQYDDLADATGGIVGNINNRNPQNKLDFSDIMSKIASGISGDTVGIKLDKSSIVSSTISVKLNETILNMSETNGWRYEDGSNSIVIVGTKLKAGDQLNISYSYAEKIEIPE